jgi:hypothetical protein
MTKQYKLYREFENYDEFDLFIKLCKESECYPWNINTLRTILNRQTKELFSHPNNPIDYSCSWTYSDKDRDEVVAWHSWMVLKYNIHIELTTLTIDEQTNQVMETR